VPIEIGGSPISTHYLRLTPSTRDPDSDAPSPTSLSSRGRTARAQTLRTVPRYAFYIQNARARLVRSTVYPLVCATMRNMTARMRSGHLGTTAVRSMRWVGRTQRYTRFYARPRTAAGFVHNSSAVHFLPAVVRADYIYTDVHGRQSCGGHRKRMTDRRRTCE
jgi:hypothetical protein